MRFLHTADWHVGKTLKGRSRLDEQEQVLTHLLFGETEATGEKLFVLCDAPVDAFPKLPRACRLMFGPGKR